MKKKSFKGRSYNPYLLPPWLRKTRFFCKQIIIPITVFQGVRTLFFPTTGDILFLIILAGLSYLFITDFV